jgi:hypothetical protein
MPDMISRYRPEKRFQAACGLFCPSCTLFIGTTDDPARLDALAKHFNLPLEEVQCEGCRSNRLGFYCRECKMKRCTTEKDIEFCVDCDDYPCEELVRFKEARPHRIDIWDNLSRIRDIGYEAWFNDMLDHYACPNCGTINSTYDLSCRNCGVVPSCEFVRQHGHVITEYLRSSLTSSDPRDSILEKREAEES